MKKPIVWIALLALAAGAYFAYMSRGRSAGSEGPVRGGEGVAGAAAEAAVSAPAKARYNCAMHPDYISDKPGNCPFCGMKLTLMTAGAHAGAAPGRGVRIDPAAVQNIGVRTERVGRRILSGGIRAGGRIAVDETRQFTVSSRVAGWAENLHVASTGQAVRKGEPLLDLYSPELVSTQEEYLQALHYHRSLGQAPGAAPAAAANTGHASEARQAAGELLESARRRLINWGLPQARLVALDAGGAVARTAPLLSPAAGVVLEKKVMQGQNVMPGEPLYRIADLSRVWVVASVYQADLGEVREGASAEITLSHLPGKAFAGRVAFVSPVLDPQTRTAEVRIEAANSASLDLKPEMLATVLLRSARRDSVIAVPEQAIIRSGRRDVAIVSLGGGYFEPRDVTLGRAADGYAEVLSGLAEGESLVISSQFLIDSESNLKAAIQQLHPGPGAP